MKKNFNIFLFITFLILISTLEEKKYEEKIIYLPIELNFQAFYANIYIGEPRAKILLPLDQELQIFWAESYYYNPENSITSKFINETKISFRYMNFYGKTISDKICLSNNINITNNEIVNNTKNVIVDDFWMIKVGNIRGFDNRVGGIGLAYKFVDERYSLIHELKKRKLISHLSYGFIPPSLINSYEKNESINISINDTIHDKKNKDGVTFFGGIPKNYIFNKYRYNCKLSEKYNFWSCELPYVFIGEINKNNNTENIYFENGNYAYFNAAERRILAPKDFIYFLKTNYFFDELLNGDCKFYLYGANHVFECKCELQDKFPNVSFIFNNYKYTLTSSELFTEYGGGFCHFLIQENHMRKNNFAFGTPFMSKFISNFDYETKYISFYTENKLEEIDIEELFHPSHLKRYLMILGLFLLIIGLIYFTRKKLGERQHKKDLLLKIKSKGKEKIKKMNSEEEGYELE